MENQKLVVVIVDGLGVALDGPGNAVSLADTPLLDQHWGRTSNKGPHWGKNSVSLQLTAHGPDVGKPVGVMGNSEVGHSTIFSGGPVDEVELLIDRAIESGELFAQKCWKELVARGKAGKTVNFLGLLSDGMVHANIAHLEAMIERCAKEGVKTVRVWALLDGRDVAPHSAEKYLERIQTLFDKCNQTSGLDYKFAMLAGRGTTLMDRGENNWGIVQKCWEALFVEDSFPTSDDWRSALAELQEQAQGEHGTYTDELLDLRLIGDDVTLKPDDCLLLFNYRTDRIRQFISWMLEQDLTSMAEEQEAKRKAKPEGLHFVVMQDFDPTSLPVENFFFGPLEFGKTLVDLLGEEGRKVFAVSEPSKYPHVTSFTNKRSDACPSHCDWFCVSSSQKAPFKESPGMSMEEIANKAKEVIKAGEHDLIIINLPAPDMVGHEADLEAAKEAVGIADACMWIICDAAKQVGIPVFYGGDHGNAEKMFALTPDGEVVMESGEPVAHTAHTTNPVRWTLVYPETRPAVSLADLPETSLGNISATIAYLMGLAHKIPEGWRPSLFQ